MSVGPEPLPPVLQEREDALEVLAELIARGGPEPLLAPPVIPGPAAFPEPWRATRGGVVALLRRLAWHVENPRAIRVLDERLGAPPTERKPETRVALINVRGDELCFRLEFLGDDDIVGTLAHELGVAHAAVHRRQVGDPYRAGEGPRIDVDPDRDLARGSIATVYLGLGALAANAAFQEYRRGGRFNGGYQPLEYDVLRAGYAPMSVLAYLLAVQAAIRGAPVPPGLAPPQRDEVSAWLDVLRPRAMELRARLGIANEAPVLASRPQPVVFEDRSMDDDERPARANAFRWRTHRGGVGFLAGALVGMGFAVAVASQGAAPWLVFGGAGSGHLIGRRVRVPRCSGCVTVVSEAAVSCDHCGAALRGDIASLADRLDAEEELADGSTKQS